MPKSEDLGDFIGKAEHFILHWKWENARGRVIKHSFGALEPRREFPAFDDLEKDAALRFWADPHELAMLVGKRKGLERKGGGGNAF